MGLEETQVAIVDMYDIRASLSDQVKNQTSVRPEITIGECIDDVILFLEELETTYQEQKK
jgi:hypothetical protein